MGLRCVCRASASAQRRRNLIRVCVCVCVCVCVWQGGTPTKAKNAEMAKRYTKQPDKKQEEIVALLSRYYIGALSMLDDRCSMLDASVEFCALPRLLVAVADLDDVKNRLSCIPVDGDPNNGWAYTVCMPDGSSRVIIDRRKLDAIPNIANAFRLVSEAPMRPCAHAPMLVLAGPETRGSLAEADEAQERCRSAGRRGQEAVHGDRKSVV